MDNKVKDPNSSDKIEETERIEILIEINQRLRDDQQTVIEMIKEN